MMLKFLTMFELQGGNIIFLHCSFKKKIKWEKICRIRKNLRREGGKEGGRQGRRGRKEGRTEGIAQVAEQCSEFHP
jgi:hypothetical protein